MIKTQEWLKGIGIKDTKDIIYNASPSELIEKSIKNHEAEFCSNGAIVTKTGEFSGRSPKDRYIIKDKITENELSWDTSTSENNPFSQKDFDNIFSKVKKYLRNKKLYIRDSYVCTNPKYRLNLRIINTLAWQNLFSHNMFLRPDKDESFDPDFTIFAVPDFVANPIEDNTKSKNFVIINLTQKIVIIGGTKYAGEIKKSVFYILNYLLPKKHNVLSMHCSANIDNSKDTALFFGLSGTGKTTLSADTNRYLIGDDEHGWAEDGIFNFEGGCYAKTINLSPQNEPQIYKAIKYGATLENVPFYKGTRDPNYKDSSLTENTRTAYPIYHIPSYYKENISPEPKNIFFLTCDAYGVLPPIAKLNDYQAMYHFISGYTAKIAGTEAGIIDPVATFSACFGLAFLPLNPIAYSKLLGQKLKNKNINVWYINTGWIGGPYKVGYRIRIKDTRTIIRSALKGLLENVEYDDNNIFGLNVPQSCPGLQLNIFNPRNMWSNKTDYDKQSEMLIKKFNENFKKYDKYADEDILKGRLGLKS